MPLTSPRFRDNQRLQAAALSNPYMASGEPNRQAVRLIQQALIDLGYPLPLSTKKYGSPDGKFGNETAQKVKEFQKSSPEPLKSDGIIGRLTMAKFDKRLPNAGLPLPPLPDLGGTEITHRVKLHLKTINMPMVDEYAQVKGANEVFNEYGIRLDVMSGESLLLSNEQQVTFSTVSGTCLWDQTNDEQTLLQGLGSNTGAGPTDIRVFFINQFSQSLNGCAGHNPGKPAVMVAAAATKYCLAHEVCHVLLTSTFRPVHDTSDPDNLMWGVDINRTKVPYLTAAQLAQVKLSKCCIAI